jgi:hypothetical protein
LARRRDVASGERSDHGDQAAERAPSVAAVWAQESA